MARFKLNEKNGKVLLEGELVTYGAIFSTPIAISLQLASAPDKESAIREMKNNLKNEFLTILNPEKKIPDALMNFGLDMVMANTKILVFKEILTKINASMTRMPEFIVGEGSQSEDRKEEIDIASKKVKGAKDFITYLKLISDKWAETKDEKVMLKRIIGKIKEENIA